MFNSTKSQGHTVLGDFLHIKVLLLTSEKEKFSVIFMYGQVRFFDTKVQKYSGTHIFSCVMI